VIGLLDLRPLVPAGLLTLAALAVLMVQAFASRRVGRSSALVAGVGVLAALIATLRLSPAPGVSATLAGSLSLDALSVFFHVLLLAAALVAILLSPAWLRDQQSERGEYYALLLFSLVGMLGLVSSRELVSMFVALEIMSVALYALVGFQRQRPLAQEAAVKYFVTGAFSSALLLYGIALLYGATGTTELWRIGPALLNAEPGRIRLALAGAGLLLLGFGFKVASVPFHMWAPDVYQAAPTPVTAFMSAAVKVAAFGALLRVLGEALPALSSDWRPAVALLAALTMVVGNLGALAQDDLKRMLAWSSIAHAGYLMAALVAPLPQATAAIAFYLVGYSAVSLAGFGTLAALGRAGREPLSLGDLAGLSGRRPLVAAGLTAVLISLTGVPVSAGFVGKFFLFRAAVDAGWAGLAILGVLMSVVSAYYYLRVVVAMYMRPAEGADLWSRVGPGPGLALALCAAAVLGLGVYPGPLLELARAAGAVFR
jgi:NADH-quinone oxidoreductase subunit N